jgi:hypothetical protein
MSDLDLQQDMLESNHVAGPPNNPVSKSVFSSTEYEIGYTLSAPSLSQSTSRSETDASSFVPGSSQPSSSTPDPSTPKQTRQRNAGPVSSGDGFFSPVCKNPLDSMRYPPSIEIQISRRRARSPSPEVTESSLYQASKRVKLLDQNSTAVIASSKNPDNYKFDGNGDILPSNQIDTYLSTIPAPIQPLDDSATIPTTTNKAITHSFALDPRLPGFAVIKSIPAVICLTNSCRYVVSPAFLSRHCQERKDHASIDKAEKLAAFQTYGIDPEAGVPDPPSDGCTPIYGLNVHEGIECIQCKKIFQAETRPHRQHKCPTASTRPVFYQNWTHKGHKVAVDAGPQATDQKTAGEWALQQITTQRQSNNENPSLDSDWRPTHPFYQRTGFDVVLQDIPLAKIKELKAACAIDKNDALKSLARMTYESLHKILHNPQNFALRRLLAGRKDSNERLVPN